MQNKAKKFLTKWVEKEIKERWFSVYNYISIGELLLTVRKDYLHILNRINIFFGIISIILWIISFYSGNYFLFLWFIFLIYSFIFLYLFLKLIKRTHYFLKISDIVYTDSGIILWEKIFKYSNNEVLEKKLVFFEKQFSEYLWMNSKLKEIIEEKKRHLMFKWKKWNNKNILKKVLYYSEKIFKKSDSEALARLAIPALISFFVYVFFMYVFYYVWYFLSFIFFYIYSFFLKIILYFKDSVELKIKEKTLQLDNSFSKIDFIYKKLKERINNFKSWEIENIENFVWKEFSKFYDEINSVLDNKNKLLKIIENSKYKNFINFEKLKNYLKLNFNKPLKDMISMLKQYENLLEKSLLNFSEKNENMKEEYIAMFANKKIILEKNLENIKRNILVLEATVM